MYTPFKTFALSVMKAPTAPPEPPAGDHASVQVYRASPSFLTYRLLGFWVFFLVSWFLALGFLVGAFAGGEPVLVMLAVALMPVLAIVQVCFYFVVRIDYDMRYYVVTDRSLRVREGAFIVKEMTISYANIQNIRVVQGPLMRLFGIRHLQVDTAGGGASEKGQHGSNMHRVRMAGVESAHEVRDHIQRHLRTAGRSAGLGDLDDVDDDTPGEPATGREVLAALRDLKSETSALARALR
jgi:membrane protein YdbS with pleckstrin-like domain